MRPVSVGEAHPVVFCQLEATARVCIGHNLGARYSVRIELVIPRRVERIGPVHPLAIATDLYHLRTACICLTVWVRRAAGKHADLERAPAPPVCLHPRILHTHAPPFASVIEHLAR